MTLIQQIEAEQIAKLTETRSIPLFRAGDTLRVGVKVVEGERTRVQNYEGVCIALELPQKVTVEITETEPVTESPNVGKEHMVVDIIQPSGLSCETNFETLRLSWSGWTIATNKFRPRISRSWQTIEA